MWLALALGASLSSEARAAVVRKAFSVAGMRLVVEVLDDDLIHVEAAAGGGGAATAPLYTSPMVQKTDYGGPSSFVDNGNTFETADLRVDVDPSTLELRFVDKTQGNAELTRVRPLDLGQALKRLQLQPGTMRHVYGLGQRFQEHPSGVGPADGDWTALGARESAGGFGNTFEPFSGGMVGNVQVPILYAIGPIRSPMGCSSTTFTSRAGASIRLPGR